MRKRKLLDGSTVDEYSEPIFLIVKTRCPEKWRLIDEETGEEYRGRVQISDSFDSYEDRMHWKKLKS